MILAIELSQDTITLELSDKGRAVDIETAKYYHDIDDVLITSIDRLLKRNKIDIKSLKSYRILGNLGSDSTSYKIAQAFVEGLKVR
jgi:tRNA A37 threonylcarbamoyladenosine modification protein TsaB